MMKLFKRAAVLMAAAVVLCPLPVDAQSSTGSDSANPAAGATKRRGFFGFRSPSNSYYYGSNTPVQNPDVATAQPDSAAPAAAGAGAQNDHVPVRIEEDIPVNEQPKPNAAVTAAAENANPGSVSYLNQRINFPRDRGDDIDVLKLQVFLDYHGYSPGEMDGRWGYNTERALYVYQRNNAIPETGQLDDRMMTRLNAFREGFLLEYVVTSKDVSGPYYTIPRDFYEQSRMKFLPYETALEALGEKFHCSQSLLRKLNPGVDFTRLQPGQKILGLNVVDGIDEKRGSVTQIKVSKHNKWAEAFDAQGRFMFYYPSTLGSEHDPLPIGLYSVANVVYNPPFKFQPKLFWDYKPTDPEAMIPPGPNCPVGVVWIGTTRKSVGIHGTPNPDLISRNTSHGCIRLTNWDAVQLSKRVKEGVRIDFVE